MKKLIVGAICAMCGIAALADYQVYDVSMSAKTTKAKGIVTTVCDEYAYRDKSTVTIKGIIAGCHCGAILANGTCDNALVYLWDATHQLPITNVTSETGWCIQRVGKNETVVEHCVQLTCTYGYEDEYKITIMLAGFGTYKPNKVDDDLSYVSSISGNFAGYALAPLYVKYGKCTACSSEPDMIEYTEARSLCTSCETASMSDYTPFYGTYTIKYNGSKSKKCVKSGVSASALNLPSYVSVADAVVIDM